MRTPFPGGHYHVDFYPFMALLCGFSTQGLIAVHVFQLDTSEVVLHELFCVFFLWLSMATVRLNLWMDALGHFQSRGPQLYCHIVVFLFLFPPPQLSSSYEKCHQDHSYSCVVHTCERARLGHIYVKWHCSVVRHIDLQPPTVLQRDDVTFHSQKLFLSLSIVLPPCQPMIVLAIFFPSFFMLPNLGVVVCCSPLCV